MRLLISFLSLFTGRAIWYELAAKVAERDGNRADALLYRNAAFRERLLKY